MKDRIQRLIDDKNLTPSRFADEVGLNRPAVSHILNGRNNPSMDALQKILKRFPEISGSWLLTGEGSMYQFNTERDSPTLFDENP
jgi:transcriptional regulator with XRE-family HTH domain